MKKTFILLLLLFAVPMFATVSDGETIRQYFTCNGSDTEFTFTFKCNSSDDVKVYKYLISTGDETALTEDTDYSIAATGGSYLNGGVVTISPAVASTYKIAIVRTIKQSQETASGAITPISAVSALDKLTRLIQDLQDRRDRSVHLQESDPDMSLEMPSMTEGYLAVNDNNAIIIATDVNPGNVTISSFMETVLDDVDASGAMATLSGIPICNVKTYGATGDGSTDDTAAIQAAIDSAGSDVRPTVIYFPKGDYLVSDTDADGYALLTSNKRIILKGEPTGFGSWATRINCAEVNTTILHVETAATFSMAGLSFQGAGRGSGTGDGVEIATSGTTNSGGQIENCWFSGIPDRSLWLGTGIDDLKITNTTLENCVYGIYAEDFHCSIISNCHFYGCSNTDGGSAEAAGLFYKLTEDGDVLIIGNYFTRCTHGIRINAESAASGDMLAPFTVIGNNFYQTKNGIVIYGNASVGSNYGVLGGLITNNNFRNSKDYAVRLESAHGCIIAYNKIHAFAEDAGTCFYIAGTSDSTVLVGNSVSWNSSATEKPDFACTLGASTTNTFLLENDWRGGISDVNIVSGATLAAGERDSGLTIRYGDLEVYDYSSLGSEKVTNGDFDTSGTWTFGTGWAHDNTNKEADHTTGNTAKLEQDVSAVAGEIYLVVFTIKNNTYTGGNGLILPTLGGVNGSWVFGNGTSQQLIRATGTGNLQFTPYTSFDGSIDDVSVKLITGGDITVAGDAVITGGLTAVNLVTAIVDVNATEIKALRASPFELVAAPGAGELLEFVSAILILDATATGFTESDDNMAIEYDSGGDVAASETIEATGFIDQTADTITRAIPVKDPIDAAADIVNKNLALVNTGNGEYATGTGVLRVIITYRTHTSLGL